MYVIGDKEVEGNTLSIRTRKDGDVGAIALSEVLDRLGSALGDRADF